MSTVHLTAAWVVAAFVVAGCSSGSDAVAADEGRFEFVSPGGQQVINYDPPVDRGTIAAVTGTDLLDPEATLSSDDYRGDVVVLNTWGQWCPPCRAEADDLEQVHQQTKNDGVQFLGINVKDPNIEAPQDFVRSRGISYPSIYDPAYRSLVVLGGNFPLSTTPATIVLDRQHRVATVFLKPVQAAELAVEVQRVAAEEQAP